MRRKGIWLASLIVVVFVTSCGPASVPGLDDRPKNLILFISDGCGPASFTMAREYRRLVDGGEELILDPHLVGTVRTFPADTRLADSAASGTAMACGVKTNKGYVGVDMDGQPVGTLVEAAERKGILTGLITTSGITDATPAAFSAHNVERYEQTDIASQQIRQGIELLLGGGRDFFVPDEDGGQRTDGVDEIAGARELGYQFVSNRTELLGDVNLPLLGLFAPDHMAREIDRDETDEPSLTEMFSTALRLLSSSGDPFILVVETEGTDDTGHDNDAPADLVEVYSYEKAVGRALDFAREDGETLVIATSDHDTGGLAIGIGGYEWTPEVLTPVQVSVARFAEILREARPDYESASAFSSFVSSEIERLYGISDLSDTIRDDINRVIAMSYANGRSRSSLRAVANIVNDEVSRRAGLGWSTGGHTGLDVNLYSFGPGNLVFRGNMDNTTVGRKMAEIMNLDVPAVTRELRAGGSQ